MSTEAPDQSPHAESLRWFILRPGRPVTIRVVDADALTRTTVAEAVFESRPEGPGALALSVVRGWGQAPRLDLFWDGTASESDPLGYRWSVTDSGSLHVTAQDQTIIEYGPGAWHEWQP